METTEILKIAGIILSFVLGTAIPFIIALVKAIKDKKAAKTEAEEQKANADLYNLAQLLVTGAESTFAEFNTFMKNKGLSAGAEKKKSVLVDLKEYALSKHYTFDAEFWSKKIDEIVSLTKSVNAKN